jgi:hypothetical protein
MEDRRRYCEYPAPIKKALLLSTIGEVDTCCVPKVALIVIACRPEVLQPAQIIV